MKDAQNSNKFRNSSGYIKVKKTFLNVSVYPQKGFTAYKSENQNYI